MDTNLSIILLVQCSFLFGFFVGGFVMYRQMIKK